MAATRSPGRMIVKAGVALVLLAGVGFLVMRSAKSSRAEPYTLPADAIKPWTLSVEMSSAPNDPVLMLRPPSALSTALFDQTFRRSMESMRAPETTGIPLVLQGELERAGSERITPDELLKIARRAGLEMSPPTARCLAHRRLPEPDTRQQVYFAIFESPAFRTFRDELAQRLGPNFDATFLSPVFVVGTIESPMSRWMPMHADAEKDCMAPIESAGQKPQT
jgi:hypothetical protein